VNRTVARSQGREEIMGGHSGVVGVLGELKDLGDLRVGL
jgi:hypothetical protein